MFAANPNTISSGIREVWDKTYQVIHHKIPTYPAFANFRLAAGLEKGDTVNRHYRSSLVAKDMDGDGGYNRQTLTDTQEQLAINKEKEVSFYIKKLDELQNHLPVRARYAEDSMIALFNQIDGDVLGNYDQYTNSLDSGDLGGTAGEGITVNTTNVRQLFSQSLKLLQRNSVRIDQVAKFTGFRKEDMANRRGVAILSPDTYAKLLESLDGKDTNLGDSVGINGHAGRYFGFDLFVSNGVGWSGRLEFGTNPTNGDTVVVNGVTWTFKTSPATAGEIDIGSTAADSLALLVAAINGTGTQDTATTYYEVSAANRNLLRNITATDGSTYMTLKATGKGYVVVSETLTASADIWTTTKQVQHLLFGTNNSIDLVIQKEPSVEIKPRDGKVGNDVVTWAAYGYKVFNEHKPLMIDVWVRSDAY